MKKHSRIAIFHPWIKSKGGAEKVILELLKRSKHSFDVYTWIYDKKNTFEEFEEYNIKILAPKIFSKISRKHLLRGVFLFFVLFKKIPLKKYDKFLISTSGMGEFIVFKNFKKNNTFVYVHTPLREANKKIIKWNLKNRYKNPFKKIAYLFFVKIYNYFEKKAWKKLDKIIFNSELSKLRAERKNLIKNKKTKIIYPLFDLPTPKAKSNKKSKNFIYLSRINPPKRQDILLEAWKESLKIKKGYKLILIGTPEDKKYYKKIKKLSESIPSVTIKENVSKKEILKIISNSLAGIFLGYQEDFGIVPFEIISANKPLIAVDEGGYVKLLVGNPLFHKIKEKHNKKEMVQEVKKSLIKFIEENKIIKRDKKIRKENFVKKIDEFLEK